MQLDALRNRFTVLFDVLGSTVLTPFQQDELINDGYRALWAEVTAINKDFRVTPLPFTLTTTQTTALPADFSEVRTVRKDPGTQQQAYLTRWGPKSANNMYDRTYRLSGSNLYIEPRARAAGSYSLDYIPQCPLLAADDDLMDAELARFQDFVLYIAVIEALGREESDASAFFLLLNGTPDGKDPGARGRVRRWASDQRSADPSMVEDVRRGGASIWGPP